MKLGRNDRCHCSSGKKYKKCCMDTDGSAISAALQQENIRQQKAQLATEDDVYEAMAGKMLQLMPDALDDPLFDEIGGETEEYQALNDWAELYVNTLSIDDPFRKVLDDGDLTHRAVIALAEKMGHAAYAEKARELYQEWALASDYYG